MGWLRDYLWLNSSQLINGYNPFGKESQQLLTFIDNNGQNNTRTTKLSKNYQCILIMSVEREICPSHRDSEFKAPIPSPSI